MSDYIDTMRALTTRELFRVRRDPAGISEMVEALTSSLALVAAVGAGGEAAGINTLLEGAMQYAFEAAAHHAPLAVAIAAGFPEPSHD